MKTMIHKFVEFIPNELEDNVLYVSFEYSTVVHKCCCGCGKEVVTPLSPTDWQLTFDGESISLNPSIGNWGFPCQSHYWIHRNQVQWAKKWSKQQIKAGQKRDRLAKEKFYAMRELPLAESQASKTDQLYDKTAMGKSTLWSRIKRWFI